MSSQINYIMLLTLAILGVKKYPFKLCGLVKKSCVKLHTRTDSLNPMYLSIKSPSVHDKDS